MNRGTRISCRATNAVLEGLRAYARRENVPIDAALELILTDFFEGQREPVTGRTGGIPDGIRATGRPASIGYPGSCEPTMANGSSLDYSLAGLAKASATLLDSLAK